MLLYQPESGYCYNSDSMFLYDFISKFNPKGRVLDVGAGSGVVGLLVARDFPKVLLESVEKQETFVEYATQNARVNNITCKIHHSDLLDFHDERGFQYIISNPPFYHDGVEKSSDIMRHTSRYNVHLPLQQFFKKVSRLLRPQGHFIFCYDSMQFGLICAELNTVKLRVVDVQFVHSKIDRKASLVMVHARKNSKSLMNTLAPFIAFDGDEFSKEAKRVYEKARTQSIKCQL
ncbi:MAG: methyltransferase [Campylobacterota bacterium]|nr:methyltransferase [Campylobacterota bacterium]